MDTSNHEKIQTFVFLDLESTGLSVDSRMLEMAMIAISRTDLLNMFNPEDVSAVPEMPRVTHKFVKCFYPRKLISKEVENICGLSNEALHHLNPFDEIAARAIANFLNLPQPICLIAHNGGRFDFPLLKAELDSVLFRNLDVLCVDTLPCIKTLDRDAEEVKDAAQIFAAMNEDEIMESGIPTVKIARVEKSIKSQTAPANVLSGNRYQVLPQIYSTPKNSMIGKVQEPLTPNKINGEPNSLNKKRKTFSFVSAAKRRLTYNNSYKQGDIYYRLFKSHYSAHSAEHDAIALLRIAASYGNCFIEWCDIHSKKFVDVIPKCRFNRSWGV